MRRATSLSCCERVTKYRTSHFLNRLKVGDTNTKRKDSLQIQPNLRHTPSRNNQRTLPCPVRIAGDPLSDGINRTGHARPPFPQPVRGRDSVSRIRRTSFRYATTESNFMQIFPFRAVFVSIFRDFASDPSPQNGAKTARAPRYRLSPSNRMCVISMRRSRRRQSGVGGEGNYTEMEMDLEFAKDANRRKRKATRADRELHIIARISLDGLCMRAVRLRRLYCWPNGERSKFTVICGSVS